MQRISKLLLILNSFLFLSIGCTRDDAVRVVHDEVLTFSLPMDLAYLRTLEAIDAHPDWELGPTDKEKGIIQILNQRYSSFADADKRRATLLLKRLGNRETTVQFSPESQAVVGGDEVLALIKQYLSREVARR